MSNEIVPTGGAQIEYAAQEGRMAPAQLSVEQLIALAIEKGVPIETMEKLMSMHERMNANRAKADFIEAMSAFQGVCPEITKTKEVRTDSGAHAYSYAPLEVVVKQVQPLLAKYGFSYRLEMQLRDNGVLMLCHVTHIGGHTETTPMEVPFGAKTRVMSDSQVVAAASTFAARYAFLRAFGIMTADEDNDGQTVPGRGNPTVPRGMAVNRQSTEPPPGMIEDDGELHGPLPATGAQKPATRANVVNANGTDALVSVQVQSGEIRKTGPQSKTPGKPYIRWTAFYGGAKCCVNYYGEYDHAADVLGTDTPESYTGELRAVLGAPFDARGTNHYTAEHIELPAGAIDSQTEAQTPGE